MRVARPYELFWKKVFEYISKHELEPFSTVFYITQTPTVLHNNSKGFRKFFSKFAKLYMRKEDDTMFPIIVITYVLRIYDLYIKHKFWPRNNCDGLMYLYDFIMKDFRESEPVTFEKAFTNPDNIADDKMMRRSWFVIDSILKDTNGALVRELIQKSIEEEQEEYTEKQVLNKGLPVHPVLHEWENDGAIKDFLKTVIETYYPNISEEEMLRQMMAEVEGDYIKLPKEQTPLYFGLLNLALSYVSHENKREQKIERLQAALQQFRRDYAGDIKLLMDEIEALKIELASQPKTTTVYTDNSDKLETVKQEYEAKIAELQKKIEMYQSQLEDITEKLQAPPIQLKPFENPVHVAYFGINDPRLHTKLAGYNVFLKTFSPTTPPSNVPDLPLIFNIEIASHKVWNKIKHKKPMLVSGSNPDKLANEILAWLNKTKQSVV